jgi:hypothetical protein
MNLSSNFKKAKFGLLATLAIGTMAVASGFSPVNKIAGVELQKPADAAIAIGASRTGTCYKPNPQTNYSCVFPTNGDYYTGRFRVRMTGTAWNATSSVTVRFKGRDGNYAGGCSGISPNGGVCNKPGESWYDYRVEILPVSAQDYVYFTLEAY